MNLAKNALPKGDAFKLRLSFLEKGLRKWKIEFLIRSGNLARMMKAKSFSGIFTNNAEHPYYFNALVTPNKPTDSIWKMLSFFGNGRSEYFVP